MQFLNVVWLVQRVQQAFEPAHLRGRDGLAARSCERAGQACGMDALEGSRQAVAEGKRAGD